jgi:hypothetical protein
MLEGIVVVGVCSGYFMIIPVGERVNCRGFSKFLSGLWLLVVECWLVGGFAAGTMWFSPSHPGTQNCVQSWFVLAGPVIAVGYIGYVFNPASHFQMIIHLPTGMQ